ncbi:hypothetical protein IW261DRAFT_1369674 [Armillaria novae-zelandiae]|uniref:Uncharacterized protein n=1 Tax=Armillaria novae-zelandiae TaxID=153914 RepID=A0AA39U9J9_9AGAR|nr:hypothetical protein IW261DRAFT_1369674 [Armillaria novae-zelandiae]
MLSRQLTAVLSGQPENGRSLSTPGRAVSLSELLRAQEAAADIVFLQCAALLLLHRTLLVDHESSVGIRNSSRYLWCSNLL